MMFTIIIPVYNEEGLIYENTKRLLEYIHEMDMIILVDNGSTDRTLGIGRILEMEHPGRVRMLSIKEKGCVGLAFREGVNSSAYGKIISLDMDLSAGLEFIPECDKLLDDNSIVIGSKKAGGQDRKWYRELASRAFIWMTDLILGIGYSDYSMGAKGYRKDDIIGYIDSIDKGSAYVYELIYWLKRDGKKIVQVPIVCHDIRKSKFNIVKESFYRFRKLLALKATAYI